MSDSTHFPSASPVPLTWQENLIQWLLRMMGGMVLLAIVPVFFPAGWMVYFHRLAGLGSIPDQPIFWYLTRSLSLMYFVHGTFVFALSTDVRRYWTLIKLLCGLNVLIGCILIGIDINAPMPWWWTLVEGPGIIGGGVLLLMLVKRTDNRC